MGALGNMSRLSAGAACLQSAATDVESAFGSRKPAGRFASRVEGVAPDGCPGSIFIYLAAHAQSRKCGAASGYGSRTAGRTGVRDLVVALSEAGFRDDRLTAGALRPGRPRKLARGHAGSGPAERSSDITVVAQRLPAPRSSKYPALRRDHWAVGRPSVRKACLPSKRCGQPAGESSHFSCRP